MSLIVFPLSLTTKEIETRSASLGLFQTLKTEPQAFYTHMSKYVYPGIAGVDLQRLLYYYTLLESCLCTDYLPSSTMTPDTHVKLLKKLKAVASGEFEQHRSYILLNLTAEHF